MNTINYVNQLKLDLYIRLCRLLPIKKNKIILWANSFKQYGCSPKYITEYLLKYHPKQFDIIWVFENGIKLPSNFPDTVRVVRYFSLEYLKELHTAHFVVCNMRTGSSYLWHKRKGQKYIQTWHSSLRLKMIEKDAQANLPEIYIHNAINDSKKIDLLISGCDFSTKIFSDSFWYNGEILKSGTPRCDLFFTDNRLIKQKVYDALSLSQKHRIVLYAPTFRKDSTASIHNLDFSGLVTALSVKFGGDWCVVYRFHPNILSSYLSTLDGVDATSYPDMQELIAAADVLITDYSSCMFDMAIADKPCLLYAPDLENYENNERSLYFKPINLPFPIAKTNQELTDLIKTFDINKYKTEIRRFLKSVGSYEDGNATRKVVSYILHNL